MTLYTLLLTLLLATFSNNLFAKVLFSVHGSNTIGSKLAPQLAKSYLSDIIGAKDIRILKNKVSEEVTVRGYHPKNNSPLDIEIKAHGSSTGFASLKNGDAQICMSSRPIKDIEVSNLSHLGDLKSYQSEITVGLDGIAIITHKNNPLYGISSKKLTDIFSGKIKYWGNVDKIYKNTKYEKEIIKVYARDNNSGTYDTFKKFILTNKTKLISTAKRYESNAKLSDHVSKDPLAIGFVSLPNIRNSKALAVSDGNGSARLPTNLTVATEDYALSRRLYMYISENERNENVINFIKYINNEKGQQNVDIAGYVSQNIYSSTINTPDFYPDEYKEFTKDAKRLSVNIRFKKGSLTPDNRAKRDLTRIADYLKDMTPKPKDVMLFGFSEDTSLKMFNISLSEARADYVELLLKKKNIIISRIRGFGNIDQVANNKLLEKNRRVEIWVK